MTFYGKHNHCGCFIINIIYDAVFRANSSRISNRVACHERLRMSYACSWMLFQIRHQPHNLLERNRIRLFVFRKHLLGFIRKVYPIAHNDSRNLTASSALRQEVNSPLRYCSRERLILSSTSGDKAKSLVGRACFFLLPITTFSLWPTNSDTPDCSFILLSLACIIMPQIKLSL